MRNNFENEIEALNQDVLKMGSMVEETVYRAITSLVEQDLRLAKEVIDNDDKVDDYQEEIEQRCIKLMALQQPVAKDLRRIDMISKLVSDLERVADLSQNIAKVSCEFKDADIIKPLVDIPRMAEIVQGMIRDSLEAFVNLDDELAKEVAKRDDSIDKLDSQVFRELLTYMMEDNKLIRQGNRLIFVSRYLERMGDHITNICERVIYIITADRVNY